MTWRVGTKLGRTIYRDDALVGLVDTQDLAAEIVASMNGAETMLTVRTELESIAHNAEQWKRAADRYRVQRSDLADRCASAQKTVIRARDLARRASQLYESGGEGKVGELLASLLREMEMAVRAVSLDAKSSSEILPPPPVAATSGYGHHASIPGGDIECPHSSGLARTISLDPASAAASDVSPTSVPLYPGVPGQASRRPPDFDEDEETKP